jgi:hypothetical protein
MVFRIEILEINPIHKNMEPYHSTMENPGHDCRMVLLGYIEKDQFDQVDKQYLDVQRGLHHLLDWVMNYHSLLNWDIQVRLILLLL